MFESYETTLILIIQQFRPVWLLVFLVLAGIWAVSPVIMLSALLVPFQINSQNSVLTKTV